VEPGAPTAEIATTASRRNSGDDGARPDARSSTAVLATDDREMVAAIAAGDPAGIASAYDRYAAALYGYCHWMLRQPTAAAEALKDTFVIAAITLSDPHETPQLRPWLYAVARNECLRRLRTSPPAHVEEADEPDQRGDAGQQIDIALQPTDATLPMRAVRQPTDAADCSTSANDGPEQSSLPVLVRAILAELKPREREAIELNLRHDLYSADLATALSVSWSRAHTLETRARGHLDKALGALLVARTGREACPELSTLLSDWDGRLTEQKRDLVSRHTSKCETCSSHKLGTLRPAAISGLLPLAELPPELREHILMMCASATPDAVAYRRRAARRAESIWSARFWPAIRRLSWRTLGSTPRSATAAIALTVWIVVVWVVSMTVLIFASPPSSSALASRPSIGAPSSSPAAAAVTTRAPTAPTSASTKRSRTARPSPTYVTPQYVPSASPTVRAEPSPSPSHSPTPSKSPSPSHSGSPSPSPSRSTSPSPSKTP